MPNPANAWTTVNSPVSSRIWATTLGVVRCRSISPPPPGRLNSDSRERVADRQQPREQQDLDDDLGGGARDLDLSRAAQDPRPFRVLLEKPAQPDRREAVERQGERFEEEECQVTEAGGGERDHGESAMPR